MFKKLILLSLFLGYAADCHETFPPNPRSLLRPITLEKATDPIYAYTPRPLPVEAPSVWPSYTVNLFWISHKLNPTQQSILPAEKTLARTIAPWAAVTPKESRVLFWYDSKQTPSHAITQTVSEIDAYNREHPLSAPIILQDIRKLRHVKENEEVFSPQYPVYFKVDLLKIITAVETLRHTKSGDCFVQSDLDIHEPLPPERIFTPTNLSYLKEYAIVMGTALSVPMENQFHIMTPDKDLIKALEHCIINLNFARATNRKNKVSLAEAVFFSYRQMLWYLYSIKGWGTLYTEYTKETKRPYNEAEDGFKPFCGFDEDTRSLCLSFTANNKNTEVHQAHRLFMPLTHEPKFSPASENYYWL